MAAPAADLADALLVARALSHEVDMSIDVAAAEERLVLSQLRWGALNPANPDDEKVCRRLEAQGLITKIANGRWAPTLSGGLAAAFGHLESSVARSAHYRQYGT